VFRRRTTLACLAIAVAAAFAPAQVIDLVQDPAETVRSAIAAYEALKGDPKKLAQRQKAIVWLGEIDHPDTTAFLRAELAVVGDAPFVTSVVDGIGKVARPELKPDLMALVAREKAPLPARINAAGAVARQGDAAVDELLALVGALPEVVPPAQRDAIATALVRSKLDRALRGLAPLLLKGPMPDRLRLLRLMEPVQRVAPVSAARVQLVRGDGDLETAAVAWRQLCVEKHEQGKGLAVDVLERIVGEPRPAVAAELVGGLARCGDPDLYPVLLRYGSVGGDVVRRALVGAAPAVAEDAALLKFLVQKGLDDGTPASREAARLLLTQAPVEAVRPLVERIRADLRAGKKKAIELAASLHTLLSKDPTWQQDLALLAAGKSQEERVLGLQLLLEIGSDAGITTAQESVGHKQWEVRSLAFRYLAKHRDAASIPLLIGRYGKEDGRLSAELDQALFAHTATRCFSRKEWDAWWQKHQVGFALPHPDTIKAGGTSGGGKTVAYHDIPVVSNRIAFLVDRSGSMNEKVGTDRKRTRLDEAKAQLVRVVEALPAEHRVNVVSYGSEVHPLWDALRPLDATNRADLVAAVRRFGMVGSTNIFDALEKAFVDQDVDTIYLLTDGEPSAGRIKDVEGILDEIRRWNRTRQIVIHCIAIGIDSNLCKRLAVENGGSYRYVR
jgi:hypothetical protein